MLDALTILFMGVMTFVYMVLAFHSVIFNLLRRLRWKNKSGSGRTAPVTKRSS